MDSPIGTFRRSPPEKSYTRALLYRVTQETWARGERYAQEGRVGALEEIPKGFRATVRGTKSYTAELSWRGIGLSKKCDCPVSQGRNPCKHLIALAITADQSLGISPPDAEEVERDAIPPPLVSRSDIMAMYEDPLHVDLVTLRLAASEIGSWSRPHARLPDAPKTADSGPLTLKETKRALKEIERWSRHRNYDPYFCAGEMMAGFCHLVRVCQQRTSETPPETLLEILELTVPFHRRLVVELIDSSEGLHQFGEAHLQDWMGALRIRFGAAKPLLSRLRVVEEELRKY